MIFFFGEVIVLLHFIHRNIKIGFLVFEAVQLLTCKKNFQDIDDKNTNNQTKVAILCHQEIVLSKTKAWPWTIHVQRVWRVSCSLHVNAISWLFKTIESATEDLIVRPHPAHHTFPVTVKGLCRVSTIPFSFLKRLCCILLNLFSSSIFNTFSFNTFTLFRNCKFMNGVP